MTPEQLLKPRYKVIADYPGNCLEVGTIIDNESAVRLQEHILSKYPHLFKKLEWWEERKEKDMPKYVKYKLDEKWIVCMVDLYETRSNSSVTAYTKTWELGFIYLGYGDFPATEQEYNDFIKTLTHA